MDKQKDSPVLYTEDTQTPTNINTTVQAPITTGEDGVILDQYKDQNNQYSTTPNTTTSATNSASGSGLSAATITNPDGTKETLDYSWNTKAQERADLDYKSKILETKSNYLTNRQEIESQGLQSQQQLDMQKYSQNQSNEKAGWTGGYVLDTERQMAYLKQTIQSQMYGQMELQKYGYDTSLAAARLAYDTNKYDLALEYYNTALSRAVSEAEITGYYVSPEVSEMLNQYSIASQALNKGEDPERNERILDSVYKWFKSNGISKQGVETITHQEFINTLKATARQMANFQENSALFKIDLDSFGEVDANGNLQYTEDTNSVKTIDFNKMSNNSIIEYAGRGELAKQQVMGYIEGLLETDVQNYLNSVKQGTEDNPTYNITAEGFKSFVERNSGVKISELLNSANSEESLKDILNNFSYNTELGNKNSVYFVVDNNGDFKLSFNRPSTDNSQGIVDGKLRDDLTGQTYEGYFYTDEEGNKVAYKYTSIDNLYDSLTKEGVPVNLQDKNIIDMSQDQSIWGDEIKQNDFNSSKSKKKAGEYISRIKQDINNNNIPLGAVLQLNYGDKDNDYLYMYIGDSKFAKISMTLDPAQRKYLDEHLYAPTGFSVEGIGFGGDFILSYRVDKN